MARNRICRDADNAGVGFIKVVFEVGEVLSLSGAAADIIAFAILLSLSLDQYPQTLKHFSDRVVYRFRTANA